MTLDHLNQKFLQSNPYEVNPMETALIKVIREYILLRNIGNPIVAGEPLFKWLMELTDTNPTATSQGNRFIRITGNDENFIDVIEN